MDVNIHSPHTSEWRTVQLDKHRDNLRTPCELFTLPKRVQDSVTLHYVTLCCVVQLGSEYNGKIRLATPKFKSALCQEALEPLALIRSANFG